ncbi:MAG: hypothetical protein FWE32_06925 [Oscillospiraceae bacterium]|nr:hypothetical protein [Oscillospiraceae bacterium]
MSTPLLIYIFNLAIIIGFVIPLLNLFTGWFGGIFGGDLDVDVDAGKGVSGHGLIPFNIMCLCLFLVVFGAAGHMARPHMTNLLFTALLLAGCFVVAALAYAALYKLLIKRLKENNAAALSYHRLRGMSGEVTLTITGEGMGTVSLKDSTGAAISFRAKIDPDLRDQLPATIKTGERVVVTEVDPANKLCYVSLYIDQI